jgi:uncharacterized protein YegL
MTGQRIDELNAGLETFASQLTNDELAAKRVEVAVLSFGSRACGDRLHDG